MQVAVKNTIKSYWETNGYIQKKSSKYCPTIDFQCIAFIAFSIAIILRSNFVENFGANYWIEG